MVAAQKSFLRAINERRFLFAYFNGNCEYLFLTTSARTTEIFLTSLDYANRQRPKVFTHADARTLDPGSELGKNLPVHSYSGNLERSITISLEVFGWNCPRHIATRLTEK
ncbi:hypothetical protein [Xanthobacter aminoxidans]|uniref:hypothetical protein n=1 Tax=Xanthobacter aminoxidans TaxID=186280 RepID=UPI0037270CCA